MKEKFEKGCSVAFTGHRMIPYKEFREVRTKVSNEVRELYAQGFRNFLCGMALGFDMLAAEEVLKLKKELPEIRLVAVIPYRGQSERWGKNLQERYFSLVVKADEEVVLSESYFPACFLGRNDFMLAHVSAVVAYYDGKPKGGTFYTVRKAKTKGLRVVNLY